MMARHTLGLLLLLGGLIAVPATFGQDPPAQPKVKVELRWVETKHVDGLTDEKGYQSGYTPKDIVYPHKKPAMVLTTAEVAEARLTTHDYRKSGSGIHYTVTLQLTQEARDKLAATVEGTEMRLLTVRVGEKYWGLRRYEKDKDKKFVPPQAQADKFDVSIGYFSSETEAQRLVDTFKK